MTTVLVTGATGNVGAHVVGELRNRGANVRAFVRDPRRAVERLGGDVELAVGDFDAAAQAWAQRIVKLSSLSADIGSPIMFSDAHARIEHHLRACPVPSVVLNSSFLMSNLFTSAGTIRHAGQLFAPADDAKIAMIDPRDVAAAAAVVLLDDGHDGQAYVLTGPQAITYADVAAYLSAATGRPVGFVNVPDEAARAGMLESGAPDWMADTLVVLFGELRRGIAAQTTDSVRILTGREPRGFAQFARDHRAIFVP